DGWPMAIVGGVLSTMKVALGPAAGAVLAAESAAEPASMVMPRVPSPVILLIVTTRLVPVPLSKLKLPLAELVPTKWTLVVERVLATKWASPYVTVKVIGPCAVMGADGWPMAIVGGVLSTMKVALRAAVGALLAAESAAEPPSMVMPRVP